ncbi:MAG: DNA repair protein RecN [Propionibacteriaceae bacterium]|jgi:DNA repair protein RecN (Recombination protein N)|nr:DNA repair protein RecN [Propionibacteriaceae bacterium]
MLSELRIVDLGVISEAVLEPDPGFTVVTGETGAGKTMVVTGLSLLAGQKSDTKLVRQGAERALVEGRVAVDADELGAVAEDGEVLIARQLFASRSRITVGGAQVTAAQAQELADAWVEIHGQLEQVKLAQEGRQRALLDQFAGVSVGLGAEYAAAWEERKAVRAQLRELVGQAAARAREADMLRFGLEEIARVGPQPGEDVELAAESRKLAAVDELRQAAQSALVALAGDDEALTDAPDALSLAAAARKSVAQVADADPELKSVADLLADAAAQLADAAAQLSSYLSRLEADPIRLEWIAGRRAELAGLTRKYGEDIAAVLAWQAQAEQRAYEIDTSDETITKLRVQVDGLDGRLATLAAQITAARTAAAARLAELVQAELAALAMPKARLAFEVSELAELGPHGADRVQLLFSANPGAQPGPLSQIASGGELSRVRLALEVVLAGAGGGDARPTLVFDEVDAGIGGEVALQVGRRLQRLAQQAQVIVVTHLAQVAAFADKHYLVEKSDDGSVTTSTVREVRPAERPEALARMMSGLPTTPEALSHAKELLLAAQV